jgi:hypothetical protein
MASFPKTLAPGKTREELAAALKGHVKGSAGLVTGSGTRPEPIAAPNFQLLR